MQEFISFLESQPHPHKLVVGGNHDICMDEKHSSEIGEYWTKQYTVKDLIKTRKDFLQSMYGVELQ